MIELPVWPSAHTIRISLVNIAIYSLDTSRTSFSHQFALFLTKQKRNP